MVAVRTGFPSPMQPMGGFPSTALPAGQTPVPAPVPPMPLAGFPPPPVKSPMAQQVSNAPRRRRFGDSLEGMLGRNMFAPQQQRPMPTPMMPRSMAMGGAVQYFANGGNANQQAAASMLAAGIGNVGGKAITSGAQSVQDSFASSAAKRRKKRRKKQQRLAAERAAAEQAIRDAEAAALAASQAAQQNNPNIAGPMESAIGYFGSSAASSPAAPPPPPTDITPEVFIPEVNPASSFASNLMNIEQPDRSIDREIAGGTFDDDPAFTGALPPVSIKAPDDPFTYDIGAIGFGDNRDDTQANLGSNVDVDQSGVGLPSNLVGGSLDFLDDYDGGTYEPQYQKDLIPDGYMSPDYPDMSMPMIPGVTAATEEDLARMVYPTNVRRYLAGEPRLGDTEVFLSDRIGFVDEKDLLNQGLNREGNPFRMRSLEDAEKSLAATQNFLSSREGSDLYSPSFNLGIEAAKFLTGDQFTPPEQIYGDSPKVEGEATAFEQLTPAENFESTRAMLESNVFDPDKLDPRGNQIVSPTGTGIGILPANTGGSDKSKATSTGMITSYTDKDGNTTVDDPNTPENEAMLAQLGLLSTLRENQANPNISRDPTSVNAAEAAFLQEALGQMEFDDKGNLVGAEPNFIEQVIGKIVRNLTLGMFDPNDPQKREDAKAILDAYRDTGKFIYDGKEMSIDELIEASKGDGIEPAVIGVGDLEGNTVGFTDGTGFRNTAEGTQNILTGSFDVFGGDDTTTNITTGGGDDGGSDTGTDTGVDTGHTVDEDGNIVCNTEGYVYNPETKICEPKKEEEEVDGTPGSGIGTGTSGESFEDVLKRVVVAAPDVAPISANVRPMQEGGMAGLNRAADNFLKALAG